MNVSIILVKMSIMQTFAVYDEAVDLFTNFKEFKKRTFSQAHHGWSKDNGTLIGKTNFDLVNKLYHLSKIVLKIKRKKWSLCLLTFLIKNAIQYYSL